MKILAIETSCDETACAVVEKNSDGWVEVLGEAVASSEEMHVETGGIVPEVAAREQMKAIVPVIKKTVERTIYNKEILRLSSASHRTRSTQDDKHDLKSLSCLSNIKETNAWVRENVDKVAVTVGPGLIGSLLVGVETAKSLALAWDKPLVPVNHLEGHLHGGWIEKTENNEQKTMRSKSKPPEFPVVGLVVSGGHTDLVLMKSHGEIVWLGGTRDDAAGECFDKCARVLGLPYPGGPAISAEAEKYSSTKQQVPNNHQSSSSNHQLKLPRPLLTEDTYDFSFSGLKIAVNRLIENKDKTNPTYTIAAISFELEEAVVEVLVGKLSKAVMEYKPKSVVVAGGVAANKRLRERIELEIKKMGNNTNLYIPLIKYCTDNAAMIGAAAVFEDSPTLAAEKISADPSLDLET